MQQFLIIVRSGNDVADSFLLSNRDSFTIFRQNSTLRVANMSNNVTYTCEFTDSDACQLALNQILAAIQGGSNSITVSVGKTEKIKVEQLS